MQSAVLRTLEFDRVRQALAREASTPLGRARALALEPLSDADAVRAALEASTEAVAFTRSGSLDLEAPEDLAEALGVVEIQNEPLAPGQLLGLARFIESVTRAADRVLRTESDGVDGGPRYPRLLAIARRSVSMADEIAAVRRAIQPPGDVVDDASPALREIRDGLRRHRAKLRQTLEGLTRGRDAAKYLQDQIVTDRNGRYVVVVRAEHRDAIPGIVHGSSASGASLYLEPMSTVALNNEVVALTDRERAEVHRILLSLSNAFRLRADDLETMLDVAADLDDLQARARLARRVDGIAPDLTDDGRVEFRGARHPLLIPALRDLVDDMDDADAVEDDAASGDPERAAADRAARRSRPATVVASDLVVLPPTRALVISGPNTGGKTVALKAIGLLSLMAQAGLLVPVEPGSRFTPFRSVFADIGDEQSISASLSTFSARIANLVAMERDLDPPALVLLDEVGSGTDPIEGGALGTAVIDHFRRRGATVVATTHDDALKSYAATTDGVATAAFGFNPDSYAPTYRLIYGAPGRSLALEIAERLGMPADVIADARMRRTGRESLLAAHLARVDLELAGLQKERDAIAADREAVASERRRLLERESRLAEREAILKKRTDEKLNEKLREARADVDRIVGQLKAKAEALATRAERPGARGGAPALSTGDVGHLRASARAALDAIGGDAGGPADDAHPPLGRDPSPGDHVFVPAFAADGVVASVRGRQAEVEIRGKRMRVALGDLRQARHAKPGATTGRPARRDTATSAVEAHAQPLVTVARDIVVIGATVDDAIGRVEKSLDDALLADARRLRVVHGRGTGRLREGLQAFLKAHPLVASVRMAADDEGGDAATIVELKD